MLCQVFRCTGARGCWRQLKGFCCWAAKSEGFGLWLCAQKRGLEAYSISCGQSLLYNNIFPKHKERLGKPMSELVRTVAKMEVPPKRNHFDVVVACEDDEGEDLDVPLVSIKFR